jgi:hypothetical protein
MVNGQEISCASMELFCYTPGVQDSEADANVNPASLMAHKRAAKLGPERCREIASLAASARWAGKRKKDKDRLPRDEKSGRFVSRSVAV